MLKRLLLGLLFTGATLVQPGPARAQQAPFEHLPALRGDYFKIAARELNRDFHVFVRLPEKYEERTAERFPVVYVLDGDSLFPILAANHLFLTFDDGLPEAVIVGLAYGSFDPAKNFRGVDFAATATDGQPAGAAAFQRFLSDELIPSVEGRFRVDPQRRVLFGQSRGASFVLYSAFTQPDLFWGRIASNPAFEPDRDLFFGTPETARRKDLRLAVVSGTRDRPQFRADATAWFEAWRNRSNLPWSLRTIDFEGGTHAADSTNAYRAGMRWLFER
ncbi:alpha/beta hydrolase [Caulobacter sp. NIBR2454]|uniref:alpha/beta hydrolase n=1 Tax=Caulobacter sp. NIBR2454 TaxID=3015996 RepID=UPI0022B5EA83|nr:alpha/beta hydrolase-fold protein [Caulobacter sp. NIBR2454]